MQNKKSCKHWNNKNSNMLKTSWKHCNNKKNCAKALQKQKNKPAAIKNKIKYKSKIQNKLAATETLK